MFRWNFFLFCCISYLSLFAAPPIEKVVIWGHKLHSHTHSYIHERFFRAFEYLGYPTYWFDPEDNTENFDFSHSLFITEGQVDHNIPLRLDCQYVLHNCSNSKYKKLFDASLAISMQVYTDDLLTRPSATKIAPCIYYDTLGKCLYFPWASDYLPHEIDELKTLILTLPKEDAIYWIGTISDGFFGNVNEVESFQLACRESNINFHHSNPWTKGLNRKDCTIKIAQSYLGPAIVGAWQKKKGYIPCRIFINICCGQMGVTNSLRVFELFDKKIVYNPDPYQLFYDAQKRQKSWTLKEQYELMDFIKEKHTYIARIQTLLEFLKLTNP